MSINRIKSWFTRQKMGTFVHAYEAEITFTILGNSTSKQNFLKTIEDSLVIDITSKSLERNGFAVADRGSKQPRIKVNNLRY